MCAKTQTAVISQLASPSHVSNSPHLKVALSCCCPTWPANEKPAASPRGMSSRLQCPAGTMALLVLKYMSKCSTGEHLYSELLLFKKKKKISLKIASSGFYLPFKTLGFTMLIASISSRSSDYVIW